MGVDLSAAARNSPESAVSTPDRFLSLVADKLEATLEIFRARLQNPDVPFIEETGRYIFEGGGKRVRPALLLLSAQLLGHDGEEEVTYAAVVELIHSATLVHDDIIDYAPLRRGRPTINQLWNNHRTVLLGDWLYTTSMRMALTHGRVEVIRRLCDATLKMTEGELLALERLGASDLTSEEYFSIIERKTAHLFAAACSVPALIDPARPEAGEALARYGRNLGICFQLVDDLLDFKAREDELGKPVLSDLKEGKLTLPLLVLMPRLAAADRDKILAVLEDRAFQRTSAEEILELVQSQGSLEEVGEIAQGYADAAQEQLERLPACAAREALEYAPQFVLSRRV